MDINKLYEFTVLADCLNYTKAAELLFITQPALSRHITQLEQTYNVQLLTRDTHGVSLTPAGAVCLKEFRRVIKEYDEAVERIRQSSSSFNNELIVGFLGQAVRPFITPFTKTFIQAHPEVTLRYSSATLDTLMQKVLRNELDIALVSHFDEKPLDNLESMIIAKDNLGLVVPPQSALSKCESLSFRELDSLPMICWGKEQNPHTAKVHESLFAKYGIRLNSVLEIDDIDNAFLQVGLSTGCFLIPMHLAPYSYDLDIIPITDEQISLSLVWKADNTKRCLSTYRNEFRTYYQNLPQA